MPRPPVQATPCVLKKWPARYVSTMPGWTPTAVSAPWLGFLQRGCGEGVQGCLQKVWTLTVFCSAGEWSHEDVADMPGHA